MGEVVQMLTDTHRFSLFYFERFNTIPDSFRPFLSCSLTILVQYSCIILTNANINTNRLRIIGWPPHFFSRQASSSFLPTKVLYTYYRQKSIFEFNSTRKAITGVCNYAYTGHSFTFLCSVSTIVPSRSQINRVLMFSSSPFISPQKNPL